MTGTARKLTCHEVSRLLSDGLDKDLPEDEQKYLRMHLAICDGCRNVEHQLQLMRTALRRLGVGRDRGDDPA